MLHLERKTVRRWLRAGRFPERKRALRKRAKVHEFSDYLRNGGRRDAIMLRCSTKKFAGLVILAGVEWSHSSFGLEKARTATLSPLFENRATIRGRTGHEISRSAHRGTGIDTEPPIVNLPGVASHAGMSARVPHCFGEQQRPRDALVDSKCYTVQCRTSCTFCVRLTKGSPRRCRRGRESLDQRAGRGTS